MRSEQPTELQQAFCDLTMMPIGLGSVTCLYVSKAAYLRLAELLNVRFMEPEPQPLPETTRSKSWMWWRKGGRP